MNLNLKYSLIGLALMILEIDNCQQDVLLTRFGIRDGNLIFSYPSIEPCEEKYVKLD